MPVESKKESKKLKSSLKSADKVKQEDVSKHNLGQFEVSPMSMEQTCNFENFWRSLFCFDAPPLPDEELPRNFKEFRTDSSKRLNSFIIASSKSNEINLTEFPGGSQKTETKKVKEDPAVVARREHDMADLKSVLNHNKEERLKEQSLDEDLLEAQRRAQEEEDLMAARKQHILEMKQAGQSGDGTSRPRGFSGSLPPQSPRVNPPLSATFAPSPRVLNGSVGIASGSSSAQSTPRLKIDASEPLSARLGGPPLSTPSHGARSARSHSPYHSSVSSAHFSQLSPATTGDSVDGTDLSNFTRFASSDGVSCQFYLPSREGDAKPKPARFHCDLQSTKFRLDILAASSSPSTPLHSGAEAVIKSLTFDTSHDITAVAKGRGPVVRMPSEVPDELILHITLYNKPEINLSFVDVTSRNVVYNALPSMLAISASHKTHQHVHHPPSDLMGLSHSVTKIVSTYWVEVPVKSSFVSSTRFMTKLLVTLTDDTLALFNVPKDYESVSSSGATPTAAGGAARTEEVEVKRSMLNDQLGVFSHSRWNPDSLPDGFDLMLEISFGEIRKVSHVGESEQDHIIEVFYQKEKKEETEVRIRLDAYAKRKALIVFLEDKRKAFKKSSTPHHHHELL